MRALLGSNRRLLVVLAFTVFSAFLAPTAASASGGGTGPAAVTSDSCGGIVAQSWTAQCTFVASGARVKVVGTAVNPISLTYSIPPLPRPGYAGVTVKVTKSGGKLVTSCTASGLAMAHCERTSGGAVPRGTLLTCSVQKGGVTRYECANAT